MQKNLLSKIEDCMKTFSKGQKRIALYILSEYDKAAFMTAAKLGKTVGVSESTVVRFATELGFDGYPKMQMALREMIRNKLTAVQRMELAQEQFNTSDVLERVLQLDIDRIKRTLEEISKEEFDKVIEVLLGAKRIYIVGVRSSSSLAEFLSFYLTLIFDSVKLVNASSSNDMFEQIIRIGQEDVIIGISFPRYSKRTCKALQFAALKGAQVVALTDSPSSPLTANADYSLYARSDMASFVDTLVAPLSLINALIVAIGLKKKNDVEKTFDDLEQIWDEYDMYEKTEENEDIDR